MTHKEDHFVLSRIYKTCLLLMIATSLSIGCARRAPQDIWLDIDPSIGIHEGEVDDGLAFIQAMHSPELNVRGVSLTFGNTGLKRTVPIAADLLLRFGPPGMTAHPGAASAGDFGRETAAVTAMAEALREGPMTILALGPMTNVGTLLRLHPESAGRIEAIVMVAARRPGQRFITGSLTSTPHRDFNFELDAEAMQEVLDSNVKLVFAPWEVSSKVWIRQADLDELAGMGESGEYLSGACQSWIERWKSRLGVDGFNPFDTLAVGYVSHPQLFETSEVGVWIETGPDDRARPGQILKDKPYLLVDPTRTDARQAVYCHTPKAGFKVLLMQRLGEPEAQD